MIQNTNSTTDDEEPDDPSENRHDPADRPGGRGQHHAEHLAEVEGAQLGLLVLMHENGRDEADQGDVTEDGDGLVLGGRRCGRSFGRWHDGLHGCPRGDGACRSLWRVATTPRMNTCVPHGGSRFRPRPCRQRVGGSASATCSRPRRSPPTPVAPSASAGPRRPTSPCACLPFPPARCRPTSPAGT